MCFMGEFQSSKIVMNEVAKMIVVWVVAPWEPQILLNVVACHIS
jgi:hypothetical protein